MELEKLKEFIEFMNQNQLCELEIEEEGKKIRLKKFSQEQPTIIPQVITPNIVESKPEPIKEGGLEISAPMVGTFYRAPAPGAKPYVEVGQIIAPGDVICIIEAMKLMNEIKSEIAGKVLEILVENGQPVEFGKPLFKIEAI